MSGRDSSVVELTSPHSRSTDQPSSCQHRRQQRVALDVVAQVRQREQPVGGQAAQGPLDREPRLASGGRLVLNRLAEPSSPSLM